MRLSVHTRNISLSFVRHMEQFHGKGGGLGIAETARRLSISSKTITNWVKQAQEGQDFTKHSALSDADMENSRLR
jgi:Transposase.